MPQGRLSGLRVGNLLQNKQPFWLVSHPQSGQPSSVKLSPSESPFCISESTTCLGTEEEESGRTAHNDLSHLSNWVIKSQESNWDHTGQKAKTVDPREKSPMAHLSLGEQAGAFVRMSWNRYQICRCILILTIALFYQVTLYPFYRQGNEAQKKQYFQNDQKSQRWSQVWVQVVHTRDHS